MVRGFKDADAFEVKTIMAVEGIEDVHMNEGQSFVMENGGRVDGFFSFRLEYGLPYLVHFCVRRGVRSFKTGQDMVRAVRDIVKRMGFSMMLLNTPCQDTRFVKAVKRYFKARPYGFDADQIYYVAEVI